MDDLTQQMYIAYYSFVTACGRKRSAPVTFHLGRPGGHRRTAPPDAETALGPDGMDIGLRSDLLEQMLGELVSHRPLPWLTRLGPLAPGDNDYAWLVATRAAYGRLGVPLPGFFIVTRTGWADLLNDRVVVLRPGRAAG